jgi:hypothetical protein
LEDMLSTRVSYLLYYRGGAYLGYSEEKNQLQMYTKVVLKSLSKGQPMFLPIN